MTDKATPSLRQRCDTALQSLPDAAYKTMLAALFDDLLGLAAQAAPTEAEYNPLLIDGVQHDPLCLKVYRSPLKECDCGASSRAAQPSQAPVVLAVPVNCGTGYCSCIECVVEPKAVQATSEPTDEAIDAMLEELNALAVECDRYEYGLPTFQNPQLINMRAIVRKLFADHASTVAALKARVAELEKDAARLEFVCNSPNRMVERESGLWRVYEDVAPTDHPTAVWQGITPRWHVTPREAIDAAITAALTKGQP